jgi:hypothetical protein
LLIRSRTTWPPSLVTVAGWSYNMAFFRKAAGLGQQEFGAPLGWSVASVSAAERSWDGKRVKKFDADELVLIAAVLGVPLAALYLPPEDHGTAVRYVLRLAGTEVKDLDELLPLTFQSSGQLASHGCLPEKDHRGRGERSPGGLTLRQPGGCWSWRSARPTRRSNARGVAGQTLG